MIKLLLNLILLFELRSARGVLESFEISEDLLQGIIESEEVTPQPRGSRCLLSPGDAIKFPSSTQPRSFGISPSRRALVVNDGAVHVKDFEYKHSLFATLNVAWLFLKKPKPLPYSYLVTPYAGGGSDRKLSPTLQRRLEFPERTALPYGLSEAADGRLGIGFYSTAGLEIWANPELDTKITLHELSIKPALPVFDSNGNFWTPFTIADRLDEEGDNIISLWAYATDGGRWEVFPRRQFSHVRFPHTIHIDSEGRVFVSGIAGKWPWIDGTYGLELKEHISPTDHLTRLDVYSLATHISPRDSPESVAYEREQKARFCEQHREDCKDNEPVDGVDASNWQNDRGIKAVLAPLRSYVFPPPFNACLWPLFILTGDGHAILSCYDSDSIAILRFGKERAVSRDESSHVYRVEEAWGPPEPTYGLELLGDDLVDESDNNDNNAEIVDIIKHPMGIAQIGGLQMDPSGEGFMILDRGGKRVVGAPWPFESNDAVSAVEESEVSNFIRHDA
jgi:hypothetical protein